MHFYLVQSTNYYYSKVHAIKSSIVESSAITATKLVLFFLYISRSLLEIDEKLLLI